MLPSPQRPISSRTSVGFTLIELLAVLTIIGILAAILIPTLSSSRLAADKARTRVQFAQWAAAVNAYRAEYGSYPTFDGSDLVNGGASSDPATVHLFHDLLAGRRRDGSTLPAGSSADLRAPEMQNRKRLAFLEFGEAEFSGDHLLREASGNTAIAVLVDRNLDGSITSADYPAGWPTVAGLRPGDDVIPPIGLRTGVAFYAPAPGATAEKPAFVTSW